VLDIHGETRAFDGDLDDGAAHRLVEADLLGAREGLVMRDG